VSETRGKRQEAEGRRQPPGGDLGGLDTYSEFEQFDELYRDDTEPYAGEAAQPNSELNLVISRRASSPHVPLPIREGEL